MRNATLLRGAVALALTLGAAGCDAADENPEPSGISEVEVSDGSGKPTDRSGYPEGWPGDFPIPPGASPVHALTAGDRIMTWFDSEQSLEEVKAFFTEALPEAGYTIDSTQDASTDETGPWSSLTISGASWDGGIFINTYGGRTCHCTQCMVVTAVTGFEGEYRFFVPLTPAGEPDGADDATAGAHGYPEGWPRDFPAPEGATPVYSLTAGDRVMTWFGSEQNLKDLKAFYAEALPRAGYTIDSRSDPRDSSGVWSVIEATGRRWTGGVYIAAGGGNGCRCMECMVGVAATGFDEPYGFFVPLEPSD